MGKRESTNERAKRKRANMRLQGSWGSCQMRVYTGPEYCKCTIWYDISPVAATRVTVTELLLFGGAINSKKKIKVKEKLFDYIHNLE